MSHGAQIAGTATDGYTVRCFTCPNHGAGYIAIATPKGNPVHRDPAAAEAAVVEHNQSRHALINH